MDMEILKAKKLAELREIAKSFNIPGAQTMRKADLIAALAGPAEAAAPELEAAAEEPALADIKQAVKQMRWSLVEMERMTSASMAIYEEEVAKDLP